MEIGEEKEEAVGIGGTVVEEKAGQQLRGAFPPVTASSPSTDPDWAGGGGKLREGERDAQN